MGADVSTLVSRLPATNRRATDRESCLNPLESNALAGRRPFEGATDLETLQTIIHGTPAPLGEDVPAALRVVVEKALEKDPADRYQSIREMVVDLRRLTRQGAETPAPARVQVLAHKGRWWFAMAIILLAAGSAGWWRISHVAPGGSPQIRFIAVLPLRNLSSDRDQEYFADGMAEALTTGLAQISALNVVARTSMMRYQGTKKTVREIAGELQVDAVVDGSVQRAGDRVLITAQLIDGKSAHLLWAKSYERDLRNVLALENQIAQAIAQEIEVKLTSQERARLASARQVNPQAQEAYFKARYWFHKSDFKQYFEYAKEATEKDPNYASAWAALGDSYALMACCAGVRVRDFHQRSQEAITTALRLDSNLAEAHTSLGVLRHYSDWNWRGAEEEYVRAIQLNPSFADAHLWYTDLLAVTGRLDQAILEARRAQQLDPYSGQPTEAVLRALFFARRSDELIAEARKMLDLNAVHYWTGLGYEQKGNFERAISLLQPPSNLKALGSADLGHAYAAAGKRAEALQELAKLKETSKRKSVNPWDPLVFAIIYTALGDNNQAFNSIENAYAVRPSSPYFATDPRLEPLRSDPRYKKLMQRAGLSE